MKNRTASKLLSYLLAAVSDAINPVVVTLNAKTNASTRLVTNLSDGKCTDFFIKHSVPGVKDEYVGAQPEPAENIPLEIKDKFKIDKTWVALEIIRNSAKAVFRV
ncbi:MAG: hypothetical protein PHH84_03580 [Oscillospiraceae bacterium]|nr:hypothetical protein [Oscillospiraceae bacterium]MDD4413941.1 hypothetical protein [Oscillospiraceae bacterium]